MGSVYRKHHHLLSSSLSTHTDNDAAVPSGRIMGNRPQGCAESWVGQIGDLTIEGNRGQHMKNINIKLPKTDSIDIMVLADLHLGDPLVMMAEVKSRIDYALTHDNCYVILNGDLIDNATRNSVGDVYSQIHTPQQAITRAVELLQPLADAGKLWAIIDGNHERRTYRVDGLSPTWVIAQRLGLTDKISDTSACLHVDIGKTRYVLFATHGAGGGRKIGGKMLRLDSLSDIVDADVYIMSHVHEPGAYRRAFYRPTKQGGVEKVDKLFVITAATLDYGGYADSANMQPASTTNPIISLCGTRKFACALV